MTNIFFKFNNTLNDAKDSIKRESNSTEHLFIQIEKKKTHITSILSKYNNTLNNATIYIKRESTARYIIGKSFQQIYINMTNITNIFDKFNDTVVVFECVFT